MKMRKKIMFVTYFDEHPDEGLSYVIELAKVMNEGLMIFLLKKKQFSRRLDDLMTAVTFAEANEDETAMQTMTKDYKKADENPDEKLAGLFGKCQKSGIDFDVYSSKEDAVLAIEKYFKRRNGIDIVLLGPNVTDKGNFTEKKLKRILHIVARPIVTIARQQSAVPI
jgi:hypothetical protein